jgi:hypothetical protein
MPAQKERDTAIVTPDLRVTKGSRKKNSKSAGLKDTFSLSVTVQESR